MDGPYVAEKHDLLFFGESATGCLWARARADAGQFPTPLVVAARNAQGIFKDELASELSKLRAANCPSDEEYAPERFDDGPNLSLELDAVADKLTETR
eukprot:13618294-Alexandrium_andersonii.AAC.1